MSSDVLQIKPESNLEQELYNRDSDLWNALVNIIRVATDIWRETKLRWYTEHGISHSTRIIDHIENIIKPAPGQSGLSTEELYILLAACYLHDIGMQDMVIPGKNSPLSLEDEKIIRERHPERSASMIGEYAESMKINSDFLEAIMVIVESHGTKNFTKCVEELTDNPPQPRGKEIRGPFLAALLMIADELDLHESRSQKCLSFERRELENFSPESLLHIYKHHYVTRVDINRTNIECRISLTFQFPEDSIDSYANDIVEWVITKLQRQFHATQEILKQEFRWDNITVRMSKDYRGIRKALPEEVIPHLGKIVLDTQLINRDELIHELDKYAEGTFFTSKGIHVIYPPKSDLETIKSWFIQSCECAGTNFELIDFDPLESWGKNDIVGCINRLLQDKESKAGILIISNLHHNEDIDTINYLLNEGLENLLAPENDHSCATVIFTESDNVKINNQNIEKHYLTNFTEKQIHKYLTEKLGCEEKLCKSMIPMIGLPEEIPPSTVIERIGIAREKWVERIWT